MAVSVDDAACFFEAQPAAAHAGQPADGALVLLLAGGALGDDQGEAFAGRHGREVAAALFGRVERIAAVDEELHLAADAVHVDGAAQDQAVAAFDGFEEGRKLVFLGADAVLRSAG